MNSFNVFVPGTPRPQGSMSLKGVSKGGKPMLAYSHTTVQWRADLKAEMQAVLLDGKAMPFMEDDGPLELDVSFYFDPPKAMRVRDRGNSWKQNGADLDKLCRAIGDALTDAQVIEDDRQISSITARKLFTGKHGLNGNPTESGAQINVRRLA